MTHILINLKEDIPLYIRNLIDVFSSEGDLVFISLFKVDKFNNIK